MRILSIDAATKTMGVAVAEADKLIASASLNVGKTHSQRLLPLLQDILKQGGIPLDSIDLLAVTIGPGSFTGLRIGIATAKGVAEALGKKIVPVCTLDALAYNLKGYGHLICPILDARKNEVYYCLYDQNCRPMAPVASMEPKALASFLQSQYLPDDETKIVFLGDGADLYYPKMQEIIGEQAVLAPTAKRMFMAESAAFLGLENHQQALSPIEVKAFYLRISEAEARRKAALGQ